MALGQTGETRMLTGAITAVVVIALIYAWSASRPIPPIDTDFGDRKVSFSTPVPPDQVFGIVENAGTNGGSYKLGRADASRGRVLLHDGLTLSSFGSFYPVDITRAEDGQTRVTVGIRSKYPLQVDPVVRQQQGKAHQKIADYLKSRIAAEQLSA
jgi:hypothetical protein